MKKIFVFFLLFGICTNLSAIPLDSEFGTMLTTSIMERCLDGFYQRLGYIDVAQESFCECITTNSIELVDLKTAEYAFETGDFTQLQYELGQIREKLFDLCMEF